MFLAVLAVALLSLYFGALASAGAEEPTEIGCVSDYRNSQKVSGLHNVPATEIEALWMLYNATNGTNWHWHNESDGIPWTFGADANPCTDDWQGITCSKIPPMHVTEIILADHGLQGSLPNEIGNFTHLMNLQIENSKELVGTIPATLERLTMLVTLVFNRNGITGTMPSFLQRMGRLQNLVFIGDRLRGTIPTFLCSMTNLTRLGLNINLLHGSIPPCLCNLYRLEALDLANNTLSGTIPECISNYTMLRQLDLSVNQLTGTIPASLGSITNLKYVALYNNMLSGHIPPTFSNLSFLVGFYAYKNHLSGPLPASLINLSKLNTVNVGTNWLSGTLPEITQSRLEIYAVYDNRFTGTIPVSITQLRQLKVLEVYECHLTGSIPTSLAGLPDLIYLQLYSNRLTGPIPGNIGQLNTLRDLELQNNFLSGTLPQGLGLLNKLQYVWLNNNLLEGTIPRGLSLSRDLSELLLSKNKLHGTLDGFFSPLTQHQLQTIDLSDNQLSGSLPRSIYALPALNTFAAVSNCFVTTLTEEVCACTSLMTLALDGLQSSSKCQQKLLGRLSHSYQVAHPMKGGIPACIFSMPNLTTLHLSGNGLDGSLPPDLVVSPSLVDLSLSHNSLTGTIPPQLQQRQWYNLDLSFNRLTGTLSTRFAGQPLNYSRYIQFKGNSDPSKKVAVELENNRLSGVLPGFIHTLGNVSVLGTNMFSCDVTGSDLPQHDRGRHKYTCGSDAFNTPYYVWLGLVVCAAAGVVCTTRRVGSDGNGWVVLYEKAKGWLRVVDGRFQGASVTAGVPSLFDVAFTFDASCRLTGLIASYLLVILLPLYLGLSYLSGTYTHMYAWSASAAFLSGRLATALEMTFLLGLLVVVIVVAYKLGASHHTNKPFVAARTASILVELRSLRQRMAAYALFMTSSFIVVIGVNVAYVYVALYATRRILLLSQILLSFFKLFWNKVCATYLMRWTANAVHRSLDDGNLMRGKGLVFVLLVVTLVNNIAIPCLVVAVVSPSCFYNVFVPAPPVSATYAYNYCTLANDRTGNCIVETPTAGVTGYNPPFSYSFQCSSSFITYYAPAFVFLCITASVLTPLSEAMALWVHTKWPPTSQTGLYRTLLHSFLPRILRPLVVDEGSDRPVIVARKVYNPYFDANRRIVNLFSYLGILVTYGAVFPPLGVAVAVTVYVSVVTEKVKLGRFLAQAQELGSSAHTEILEAECKGTGGMEVLLTAVHMIAVFACWFYTLFLFDTLGDAVGFEGAYWVLIVVPSLPVVVYVTMAAVRVVRNRRRGDREDSVSEGIVLSPMAVIGRRESAKDKCEVSPVGVV